MIQVFVHVTKTWFQTFCQFRNYFVRFNYWRHFFSNCQLKDIISAIIAGRPEYSKESKRGAVTKAQKIVKNKDIVPGFDSNKRFVKSSSSRQPHTVSIYGQGYLICDKDCKHFKEEKYCAHFLAVAVNENIVEEFGNHLEKQKATSLNSVASANINTKKVGKKGSSHSCPSWKRVIKLVWCI